MEREFDGYRLHTSKDLFTGAQKKLIEAWAHGFQKPAETAIHLGLQKDTVLHTGQMIRDKMYEKVGTDHEAKAVTFAALNGWIDPIPFPDRLKRKLTNQETQILTFRALGLTKKEVADKLTISPYIVDKNLGAIHHLLGNESDYFAIAWAIIKVLKKKQPSEPK